MQKIGTIFVSLFSIDFFFCHSFSSHTLCMLISWLIRYRELSKSSSQIHFFFYKFRRDLQFLFPFPFSSFFLKGHSFSTVLQSNFNLIFPYISLCHILLRLLLSPLQQSPPKRVSVNAFGRWAKKSGFDSGGGKEVIFDYTVARTLVGLR